MDIMRDECNSNLYGDRFFIFLSFRGLDTGCTFTNLLYSRLKRTRYLVFRDDDEFERDQCLRLHQENAIKLPAVSIIVFSENYASFSWCLDELVRILEQKKIRGPGYKVIPIFYEVEASDVRYQRGSYKEALNGHRENGSVSLEKIKAWETALTEAADLVGYILNKGGCETEFTDKIVCEVQNCLRTSPLVVVGISYRVEKVESWLKDESEDKNVLIICGIGGIGKTTIAKYVYDKYFGAFEGSCFLSMIASMWDSTGVCGLQSQLISSLLDKKDEIRIYNCDEGTEKITRALCSRKVLVVLDDVNETEQLEALIGQVQRLHPGSKIIVTTRNTSLLNDFIVHPEVYIVECLNDKDSLELFCWHAFRRPLPLEGYMHLSKEILWRCGGLPLSLRVMGSSLRNNMDVVFWEKQLQKLNDIADLNIQIVTQVTYDSLEDPMLRHLFLDIACFFEGEEENSVVNVLEHCGVHATVGIHCLIDRCLITTNDNKLKMHQVILDMGRERVRQELPDPDDPGKRSRLWCHKDSLWVLKTNTGTEEVLSLVLDGKNNNEVESDGSSFAATEANPHLITKVLGFMKRKKDTLDKLEELNADAFTKMVNLKFIKLKHVRINGCFRNFPKKLRWISWHGCPLEYLPMDLRLENLVMLKLQHSKLRQVWKRRKEVRMLRILDMSYSLELHQTPDFRGLPQLEKLILKGCSKLVKVCKTIGMLSQLELLDLSDCKSLRNLPELPKSIVNLELSGCDLGKFPKEQKVRNYYSIKIDKSMFKVSNIRSFKFLSSLPEYLVRLGLKDCNQSIS